MMDIDYREPGALTDLQRVPASALVGVPTEAVEICRLAHTLVIQPGDAKPLGVPDERFAENQVRRADTLVEALLSLDPAPLDVPRAPDRRVIGTCRHFAVLSCALLRHRGIAARARNGFAIYFQPGQGVDHWIIEYRHDGDDRWVRVDSEIIAQSLVPDPTDLRPGEFLTGGEAWASFRAGRIDATRYGVFGTGNWGPGEIRANALKDLAALNKVEMLPWDAWGRMDESFQGKTGADYDNLHDRIAAICAADDPTAVAALYHSEDLRVPTELVC
ncbi:transglutaminase-like domain-containing protein [Micromonospora sp. NPDC004704]